MTFNGGTGTRALFVYGTLRPGDVRWSFLEPFVVDDGIDNAVAGRLFDTGLDYPEAVFDGVDAAGPLRSDRDSHATLLGASGTIVGRTFELRVDTIDRALAVLDEEEDTVLGLYRRVVVMTTRGTRAWAYAYGDGLELTPIPSGDWFTR